MTVIFFTRFSIPIPENSSSIPFKTAREHRYKDYLNILFSYERLKTKLCYFKNMCLPSIINQTSNKWKWYIFTSHKLPSNILMELQSLIRPYSAIQLHFVEDLDEFRSLSNKILEKRKEKYINCRIDDDDGIHKTFVEKMLQYLNLPTFTIINFTEAIKTSYDTETDEIFFHDRVQINHNSIGLGAVNSPIHKFGNHNLIHEKNSILYDRTPGMVFQACDQWCDTKRQLK